MASRKIKLPNANFRSWSGKLGSEAMTTVHISAPLGQLVADQIGVKERVYGRKRDEDGPDVRSVGLGIDWYGPQIVISPRQATLNGKVKLSDSTTFRALRLFDVVVKRHKDDEQMLVSFKVLLLDDAAEMHTLLHTIKKDGIDVEIIPPSKKAAAEASDQLRLISKEQADDTEGEDE